MAAPSTLESLKYSRGTLEVLDQLVVPHSREYLPVKSSEDAWTVIRNMNVRGAPLIAIVACLGLAVEAHGKRDTFDGLPAAADFLVSKMEYLRTSRPTAVNLFGATDELIAFVKGERDAATHTAQELVDLYIERAEAMLEADVADNRAIGAFGADAIQKKAESLGQPTDSIRVMTICNTGSLATAGYGTALGVVRALHERKALEQVYACETRPYNQGARLTAFEIVEEGIPGTLICDSMASSLMRKTPINAVVVGADRVAANGDTANKIGTYQLAIIAKFHGADFYVAAPSTSIDLNTPSGDHIPIEERPAQELRSVAGTQIAPESIPVWNPAFDFAPASLITGIITEHGVAYPNEDGVFDLKAFLSSQPDSKRARTA